MPDKMWNVVSLYPKQNSSKRGEKICDNCGEKDAIVLTKHHYKRREISIRKKKGLSLPKGRLWDWRCANCHMAFNRLGVIRFYAGYWKKQSPENEG